MEKLPYPEEKEDDLLDLAPFLKENSRLGKFLMILNYFQKVVWPSIKIYFIPSSLALVFIQPTLKWTFVGVKSARVKG